VGRGHQRAAQRHRSLECKAPFGHASEPWKTWNILAGIETNGGNPSAAAQAKQEAVDCFLAYRRDSGENPTGSGRLVFTMIQQLATGGPAAASSFLRELAAVPDIPAPILAFIQALQAIVNGSRDRALAAAPDLDFTMAAEILILIETLEAGATSP
jgi:hypothetical protein